VLCGLALTTGKAPGQQIPQIEEQNLSGRRVVLPDAVSGKVAVLILGFTRASKELSTAWNNKLQRDLANTPDIEVCSMPVLEEVPGFVRGMVISGIKKGVPETQRDHFVPVLHHEAEWKKLVNYQEQDDAYMVVLDRKGNVSYQLHGPPSEQNYSQLRQHVEELLK
jgi:hypothetical protein